jgi:hypothetical protein
MNSLHTVALQENSSMTKGGGAGAYHLHAAKTPKLNWARLKRIGLFLGG